MGKFLISSTAALAVLAIWTSAEAADLPARPAPVYMPPAFTWTGFYLGGNIGGAYGSTTLTDGFTGGSVTGTLGGWQGGGQVGFNYQMAALVLGVEGTFDSTSLNSTTGGVPVAGGALQVAANTQWITTAAVRFGYAADRALFYGKAGGGWVGNNATVTNLATGASASSSNTNNGWLLGAGLEYAFTPNWTAKVEYDYLGLRGWSAPNPLNLADSVNIKRQINMFTVGFNYKFSM
jgi:outer membrane immunogenic protein